MLGTTVFAALLTFVVTAVLVAVLRPVARRIGLVDRPQGRKNHDNPTPAIGGLSILLAVAPLGFFVLPLTPAVQGVGLAAVVILVAGVADDLFRIRWQYRLCAQVLAALVMIYVGHIRVDNVGEIFGFPTHPLGPLAIPLTVIATVGIINAVNMIDGVDGLAGSMTLVASLMLASAALYAGNDRLAIGLGLVAGGLCAFLLFNLRTPWNPRAKIFLGNAGSELLGLIIACACFRLTQNGDHPVGVQIAPFLLAPAVIDCLTLMIRRARMGVSPFVGDRNHLHHLLLDAGLTPTSVVTLVAVATFVIGLGAAMAMKAHVPPMAFSVAFLALWAAYFLLTRRREQSVRIFASVLRPVLTLQAHLGVGQGEPPRLGDLPVAPAQAAPLVIRASVPVSAWRDMEPPVPFGRVDEGLGHLRGSDHVQPRRAVGGAPGAGA